MDLNGIILSALIIYGAPMIFEVKNNGKEKRRKNKS